MKALLTQSEKEKLFKWCEDCGKTYTKISDRIFSVGIFILKFMRKYAKISA